MDLMPVWPGQAPLDVTWLQPQRNMEIALGFFMQAVLGPGPYVDGLTAVPTSPASMSVVVGAGQIIVTTTVDTLPTGFGSLAVDNSTSLVKAGINTQPTTMSPITAPATAGQSQNWVLEALFQEADTGTNVIPYYNAASPQTPFSGPNNSGAPVVTDRTQRVALQWVAGVPATSGTQQTPAVTVGWVGLYVVTTTNGVGTVTSANIAPYPGAPFIPTKLPQLRQKLTGNLTLYVSPSGNDGNSGLSAQVPFATPQQAWNQLINVYDLNGFNATVQIADGTYTGGINAQGLITGLGSNNSVTFQGDLASPGNVVISVTNGFSVAVSGGGNIVLAGMQIQAGGTVASLFPCALCVTNQGQVVIGPSVLFGVVNNGVHIYCNQGSVTCETSYTVNGTSTCHYYVDIGGLINVINASVTMGSTFAWTQAFAIASRGGLIQLLGVTFPGSSCTGERYSCSLNGIISTSGLTLPGSNAGVTATGGQYS